MRDALKATGRPILYSICEWGQNKPWEWAADVGNSWRTTGDISDSWARACSASCNQNLPLAQYAGPGHWNDPDMLEVGNGGMTDAEYRTHFSLWAMMAAPLLIGSDLRKASAATLAILTNTDVIAVDQDPLGKQGTVLSSDGRALGRRQAAERRQPRRRAVQRDGQRRSGSPPRRARSACRPRRRLHACATCGSTPSYKTAGTISATVPAHGTVLLRVAEDRRWAAYPPAVEYSAWPAAPVRRGRQGSPAHDDRH